MREGSECKTKCVYGAGWCRPCSYLAHVDEEEADGYHPKRVQRLGQARDEGAELGPERARVGGRGVHEDDALPVV